MRCAELRKERAVLVVDCTIVPRIVVIGTMIVIAEIGTGTEMAEATPDTIGPEMVRAVTETEIGTVIVTALVTGTEMIDRGTAGMTETTGGQQTDVMIDPTGRLPHQGEATLLSPGASVSTEVNGTQRPQGLVVTRTVCFKED